MALLVGWLVSKSFELRGQDATHTHVVAWSLPVIHPFAQPNSKAITPCDHKPSTQKKLAEDRGSQEAARISPAFHRKPNTRRFCSLGGSSTHSRTTPSLFPHHRVYYGKGPFRASGVLPTT